MKDFGIIVVIVGLIVSGSIYTHHVYQEIYEDISQILEGLVKTIHTNPNKEETIQCIKQEWIKMEKILIIFQDHASMDEIENNLYECFHYYRIQDEERLILYQEKTLMGLEDIIKREELLLVDIL